VETSSTGLHRNRSGAASRQGGRRSRWITAENIWSMAHRRSSLRRLKNYTRLRGPVKTRGPPDPPLGPGALRFEHLVAEPSADDPHPIGPADQPEPLCGTPSRADRPLFGHRFLL